MNASQPISGELTLRTLAMPADANAAAVDAWVQLLERFGRRGLADALLAAATALAATPWPRRR